jgi:hypothetical protein
MWVHCYNTVITVCGKTRIYHKIEFNHVDIQEACVYMLNVIFCCVDPLGELITSSLSKCRKRIIYDHPSMCDVLLDGYL